jgi:hypothetical protein
MVQRHAAIGMIRAAKPNSEGHFMPTIKDDGPAPYVRTVDGKTEIMIPIGPHAAVNETFAKARAFSPSTNKVAQSPPEPERASYRVRAAGAD